MSNDLTKKTDFDTSVEKPKKKGPNIQESARIAGRSNHTADAMAYMMDSMADHRYHQQQVRPMHDNRRQGKSFRGVLWCLNQASQGQDTIYVCQHRDEAHRMARVAMDMAAIYLSGDFIRFHQDGNMIEFGNGARIRFSDYDTHRYNMDHRRSGRRYEIFDDCWDHRR